MKVINRELNSISETIVYAIWNFCI